MRESLRNESLSAPRPTHRDGELTVEQALALRAEQAKLAAQFADRAERARLAGEYGSMRRWMHEYRRAARRCRVLGERIHLERADLNESGAPTARRSTELLGRAPRSTPEIPPADEAARASETRR